MRNTIDTPEVQKKFFMEDLQDDVDFVDFDSWCDFSELTKLNITDTETGNISKNTVPYY